MRVRGCQVVLAMDEDQTSGADSVSAGELSHKKVR
jgi:hypothetical protein